MSTYKAAISGAVTVGLVAAFAFTVRHGDYGLAAGNLFLAVWNGSIARKQWQSSRRAA